MIPKTVSLLGDTLQAGIRCVVIRFGESSSIDAGDNARHGSNSPDVNIVLDGFMSHPPYLFGLDTSGSDGRPSGNSSLHLSWKNCFDLNSD